jgi:hypothetical protein
MKTIKQLLLDADPLRHEPRAPSTHHDLRRQAIVAAISASGPRAGSTRRWLVRCVMVTPLIALGMLALSTLMVPRVVLESHAAVRFEVRLAEESPGPGLREVKVMGTDRSIYLHEEVVVSNGDIARAQILTGNQPSQFSVGVEFTEEGARKMRAATEKHIGKLVAILIDDEVVIAPVLRAAIGESAVITGNYTREQAERIVDGIGER